MKYFTSLLILILAFSANAQELPDLFTKNIDLHVDVLPIAFPDPSVRFGSEMMMGNRWSAGLNLSVGVPVRGVSLMQEPRWGGNYRLFDIRPEVKYYWLKRERIGWYFAAEGLLLTMKASAIDGYHLEADNATQQVDFDRADFQKTRIGFNGKMGGRILLGNRFTFDFFAGMGLSNVNSSYKNYVNPVYSRSDPFFEGENYRTGRRWTAQLTAGMRLGFILWRKSDDN